jgi:hypothetical protein
MENGRRYVRKAVREHELSGRGGSTLKQVHILPPRKEDNLIVEWAEIKRDTSNESSNEINFSVCTSLFIRTNTVLWAKSTVR